MPHSSSHKNSLQCNIWQKVSASAQVSLSHLKQKLKHLTKKRNGRKTTNILKSAAMSSERKPWIHIEG